MALTITYDGYGVVANADAEVNDTGKIENFPELIDLQSTHITQYNKNDIISGWKDVVRSTVFLTRKLRLSAELQEI